MGKDDEPARGIARVVLDPNVLRTPWTLSDWRSHSLMRPGFEDRVIGSVRRPLRLQGEAEDDWRVSLLSLGWAGLVETFHGKPALAAVQAAARSLAQAEDALWKLHKDVSAAFNLPEPDITLLPRMVLHRKALESWAQSRSSTTGRLPDAGWSSWAARALTLFERGFGLPVSDPQASKGPTHSVRFLQALLSELRAVASGPNPRPVPRDKSITSWIRNYRRSRPPQNEA
jgi:hypothetical protein